MLKKKIFNSENQQIAYLIKGIGFFWLITKLWSYKTWLADRLYPVIPPADFLENIPNGIHLLLYGFSLLSLLIIIFFKPSRVVLVLLLISEIMSCSLDTVRWQPWEYVYICIICVIAINFRKPKNSMVMIHFLLISMYFFSGLHKCNEGFLTEVWLNMFLKGFFGLSMDAILQYKLFFVGFIIPAAEIVLAVLLLISKSKRIIRYVLIAMHVGILIIIGPFGLAYNSVVWIWNLAMIFILYILYEKPIEVPDNRCMYLNIFWILLWYVMPVFTFFGSWYQYFSFSVYSGKGYQMYFCVHNKDLERYAEPESMMCDGISSVNLQNWALEEIKSAPIPEPEIYKKIEVYMKKKYADKNIKIIFYDPTTDKIEEK